MENRSRDVVEPTSPHSPRHKVISLGDKLLFDVLAGERLFKGQHVDPQRRSQNQVTKERLCSVEDRFST